ncbi:MAG: uracil-DNA glycosylase [Bacillota bacterium]
MLAASDCRRCPLAQTRQHIVWGEGNPEAALMLVGEAPGAKEDESGRPFVGPAGKILDKVLAGAGVKREDVYITSVVKCRPPENRMPHKEEITACSPYLEEQIRRVRPRVIVCLGSLAARALLGPEVKISKVRGQWFERNGMKILPTFHPAAVFRGREKLALLQQDIEKAAREIS